MINDNKNYKEKSVFLPENLLRDARIQKSIKRRKSPAICVLDPDGDIVRYLQERNRLETNEYWPCYHTSMYIFSYKKKSFGIIGNAVGAPFAVLLAEELFASGCGLLISVTSAGKILAGDIKSRFVLITKALRDEGTSYHYKSPSKFSSINKNLLKKIKESINSFGGLVDFGSSWTTDAPFRETQRAIDYAVNEGINAVEMEAAALYAFAEMKKKNVVCYAHLTNSMGQIEGDFQKGDHNGSADALEIIYNTAKILDF